MAGTSKKRVSAKKRGAGRGNDAPSLPLTVSAAALLDGHSDDRFRQLVSDLLTLSVRMDLVREHLGRRIGVTGPQYSLLVAIAHFQGKGGVSVSTLADMLHVSSAFIATESGKLVQAGLVRKVQNPDDRRSVLISLTRAGNAEIKRINPGIRAVNDLFFGSLDRAAFEAMSSATAVLVKSSAQAVAYLNAVEQDVPFRRLEAAE